MVSSSSRFASEVLYCSPLELLFNHDGFGGTASDPMPKRGGLFMLFRNVAVLPGPPALLAW